MLPVNRFTSIGTYLHTYHTLVHIVHINSVYLSTSYCRLKSISVIPRQSPTGLVSFPQSLISPILMYCSLYNCTYITPRVFNKSLFASFSFPSSSSNWMFSLFHRQRLNSTNKSIPSKIPAWHNNLICIWKFQDTNTIFIICALK